MKFSRFFRIAVCTTAWLLSAGMAGADDGAASIAAGGLVLKRESRITMAKEVLRIGWTSVVVDYDFRNDTDEDVTTEVEFPIPPYESDWAQKEVSAQGYDDFRLWVNGEPHKYDTEEKARLKGRDVTATLRNLRIDIGSFGHLEKDQPVMKDLERLTLAQRQSLAKAGLIDSADPGAQAEWTVEKKYYWSQRFPAHATVHIRHEYTQVTGFQLMGSTEIEEMPRVLRERAPKYPLDIVQSMCPEQTLLDRFAERERAAAGNPILFWVDFVLTTANTWKQPIEDFTLLVERPHGPKDGKVLVSFCSRGGVEKMDADHFKVQVKDFVPQKELRIGYIQLSTPR